MDKEYFSKFVYFDSGNLRWKRRPRGDFNSDTWFTRWNDIYPGKVAWTSEQVNERYQQHIMSLNRMRLVYPRVVAVFFGIIDNYYSNLEIDHIDGNPENNKPYNLRAVTRKENLKNKRAYKNSKYGVHGVNRSKNGKRWQVRIGRGDGKKISLGAYDDFFDAVCARKAAEIKLGYHLNHGR